MAEYLPEELIVKIMERLPVESLIRFTSVSKRWRSIILFGPQFAKSQFQIDQTFRHRGLMTHLNESHLNEPKFHSAELEDNFSVRKVRCPFFRTGTTVNLLCSCNGLLCALVSPENHFYIWNPSTGFFYGLPEPIGLTLKHGHPVYYGFGYMSGSDDYKLIAKLDTFSDDVMLVFSFKANTWRITEAPLDYVVFDDGTLSNEALHWVDNDIVAFDLAMEELRRMPLPVVVGGEFWCLGDVGDCLCVFDQAKLYSAGSIDLWVMKEYGAADSWTKLYDLKIISQPQKMKQIMVSPILVLETTAILFKKTVDSDAVMVQELIRSGRAIEEHESVVLRRNINTPFKEIVEYEETLLLPWLVDHSSFTNFNPLFS